MAALASLEKALSALPGGYLLLDRSQAVCFVTPRFMQLLHCAAPVPGQALPATLLPEGLHAALASNNSLALQQVFKHVPNMERFWDTSAKTAETAGNIAKQLGRGVGIRAEDAHTFALFRDCGIPMLMIPFPEYRNVLILANQETELSFTEVEDRAIGLNHAVVGAQLAEDWLLPEEICVSIRHHHDRQALDGSIELPERARKLIAVAQLAEHLLFEKTGSGQTSEWNKLGASVLACLEIDEAALPELLATCVPAGEG